MRIVQTFWSGAGNPLVKTHGWPHAEYNLMSWALSCCSLREHYNQVILYTDRQGYEVLIEKLNLPYTEVHIVYDDKLCLPQHWAYAKIKTYYMQEEPFLHVDGDIYLSKPIPEEIINAPLIAQNREIGTIYYAEMFDRIIKCQKIKFPRKVVQGMKGGTVSSYNMGFFGGSDLNYIKEFCKEAFAFIEENDLNNPLKPHSSINCNILMEQVLFATKCDLDNRKVTTIHMHPVEDKGYGIGEFCDICRFEDKKFFHILGGHKHDPHMYEKLEKVLLSKYPHYYLKIMSLYPNRHARLAREKENEKKILTVEYCIAKYEDFLESCICEWCEIPFETIIKREREIALGRNFFLKNNVEDEKWHIKLNPYLAKFHVPDTWPKGAHRIIKERFRPYLIKQANMIIAVPSLYGRGLKETAIGDLGYNIISLLESEGCEVTFDILYHVLSDNFIKEIKEKARNFIIRELEYLLFNNIIIISK